MNTTLREEQYIVNVGPHSTFRKSGSYQTLPQHIDSMFSDFESREERKIALYFHGGLVDEKSGIEAARNIAPHIEQAGCAPVCFVWETGLIETITTNFTKISETDLFNQMLKFLLRRVSKKVGFDFDGGRGSGEGLSAETIELELQKPIPFEGYDHIVADPTSRGSSDLNALAAEGAMLEAELIREFKSYMEVEVELQRAILSTEVFVSSSESENASRGIFEPIAFFTELARIAYRIIRRFIEKRDHGIYPTIVEEILRSIYIAELGAWVWKGMKGKSNQMWQSNVGRVGLSQFVGRYFIDKLNAYKIKYPETEISLIGHSAGSIAICNLLNHVAGQSYTFSFNHIILLAPACRTELFKSAVLKHLERYKDVRIFTMSDDYECKDILVPYVYPRSLLYLVSGVLEEGGKVSDASILGLERHINFKKPYDLPEMEVLNKYLYEDKSYRLSLSVTIDGTSEGLVSKAVKHGEFDDDLSTLKSITHILRN